MRHRSVDANEWLSERGLPLLASAPKPFGRTLSDRTTVVSIEHFGRRKVLRVRRGAEWVTLPMDLLGELVRAIRDAGRAEGGR